MHTVTLSSLSGNYLHAVVQVTRDLHPVLYYDLLLPETSFDLGVADVTLAQFEALAKKLNKDEQLIRRANSIQEWNKVLPRLMISLSRFMQVRHSFTTWALFDIELACSFFPRI